MDVKTINQLAEIMAQHGLTELSLEQNQIKVHLARNPTVQQRQPVVIEQTADAEGAGNRGSAALARRRQLSRSRLRLLQSSPRPWSARSCCGVSGSAAICQRRQQSQGWRCPVHC